MPESTHCRWLAIVNFGTIYVWVTAGSMDQRLQYFIEEFTLAAVHPSFIKRNVFWLAIFQQQSQLDGQVKAKAQTYGRSSSPVKTSWYADWASMPDPATQLIVSVLCSRIVLTNPMKSLTWNRTYKFARSSKLNCSNVSSFLSSGSIILPALRK